MPIMLGGWCVYCERRVWFKHLRGTSWSAEAIVAHDKCERLEQRWMDPNL